MRVLVIGRSTAVVGTCCAPRRVFALLQAAQGELF